MPRAEGVSPEITSNSIGYLDLLLSSTLAAVIVAASVVAGISTLFSPWGLSMVETIAPEVHGNNRSRYLASAARHALGATLTAAAVGALLRSRRPGARGSLGALPE